MAAPARNRCRVREPTVALLSSDRSRAVRPRILGSLVDAVDGPAGTRVRSADVVLAFLLKGVFGAQDPQLLAQGRDLTAHRVPVSPGRVLPGAVPLAFQHRPDATEVGHRYCGDEQQCRERPRRHQRSPPALCRARCALSCSISSRSWATCSCSLVSPVFLRWPRIITHIIAPIPIGQANTARPVSSCPTLSSWSQLRNY